MFGHSVFYPTSNTMGSSHMESSIRFPGFTSEDHLYSTINSKTVNPTESESSQTMSFSVGLESNPKHSTKKEEKSSKKSKYAFQTRSQVDILDDGYKWRKYGQKAVKNNKFPRSYYRCTHPECRVKKQVQRLTKDEGVVVTTYEGMHNHPTEKPTDNFEHILTQMQIYGNPM